MPSNIHTYSVCAYGESPYLEDCIKSVLKQEHNSNVIICTSTSNQKIESLSKKYGIKLYVNPESLGIASDWNFALSNVKTPLATIAHQDDIYRPSYSKKMVELSNGCKESGIKPIILFSDYGEIRDGTLVNTNGNLAIKRILLSHIKKKRSEESRFRKRNLLRFGSAISCPAVTYNLSALSLPLFSTDMKCDLDWQTWEKLSLQDGSFCFDPEILMYHRIHDESETSIAIANNTRSTEDLIMLERFWPSLIAKGINRFYARSQKSNE